MTPIPLTTTTMFELFIDAALVSIGWHFGKWFCAKTFERL